VPDIYSSPTATYHVRGDVVIGSNNTGILGGVFLPSPIVSYIDTVSDLNLGTTRTSGMTQVGSAPAYSAVTPAILNGSLSSYRTVSWGIKITNLQPVLSAAGRLYVAVIPSVNVVPNYNMLAGSGVSLGSGFTSQAYTGGSTICTSQILDFPESSMLTVSELVTGAVQIAPTPSNPVFFSFKSTYANEAIGSNLLVSDQVETTAAGAPVYIVGGVGINNIAGGSTVLYTEMVFL